MGSLYQFPKKQPKKTEKELPEKIAHAIVLRMKEENLLKTTLNNLPDTYKQNAELELELKILTVFCKHYAILTAVKDANLRRAIFEAFISFLYIESENYFGCKIESIKNKLEMRVKGYFEALEEPNRDGAFYSVSKTFIKLMGCEYDSSFQYPIALHIKAEFKATKKSLDDILKEYSFEGR